jgi:hypothetical protein
MLPSLACHSLRPMDVWPREKPREQLRSLPRAQYLIRSSSRGQTLRPSVLFAVCITPRAFSDFLSASRTGNTPRGSDFLAGTVSHTKRQRTARSTLVPPTIACSKAYRFPIVRVFHTIDRQFELGSSYRLLFVLLLCPRLSIFLPRSLFLHARKGVC